MHPFVFALVQNQIIWCKIGNNLSNATNRCDMSSYVCIRSYHLQNGLIYILQLIHVTTLRSVRVRILSHFLFEATDGMKSQEARGFR